MYWWQDRVSTAVQDRDYPEAKGFIQVKNYKAKPEGGRTIKSVVIHITGGTATTESGAVNRFLNEQSNASAHYIVNRQGEVLQMVREKDIAKHGGQNKISIGIEHVNQWHSAKHERPELIQYVSSAKLVSYLCKKYGILMQHVPTPEGSGIKGHAEANPNTGHKNCPNPAWDWDRYIRLVNQAARAKDIKVVEKGIIGVYKTRTEAENEKPVDPPWDKPWGWECWLEKF